METKEKKQKFACCFFLSFSEKLRSEDVATLWQPKNWRCYKLGRISSLTPSSQHGWAPRDGFLDGFCLEIGQPRLSHLHKQIVNIGSIVNIGLPTKLQIDHHFLPLKYIKTAICGARLLCWRHFMDSLGFGKSMKIPSEKIESPLFPAKAAIWGYG